MREKILFGTILMIMSLLYISCSSSKPTASEKILRIQPKFDYAPKLVSKVGSAETTIALVNPYFGNPDLLISPFQEMSKNLANDFEELLTAKGFKVRGPFNQRGEMLYNDKINSDFVFQVEIDINFGSIQRERKTVTKTNWGNVLMSGNGTTVYYMYTGEGVVVCNLVLTAQSSKFHEKLWKKNITLPPVPFKYEGSVRWRTNSVGFYSEIRQDNSLFNAISKLLESQYQEILNLVEQQIDVEEMKMVAEEAREVDRKE